MNIYLLKRKDFYKVNEVRGFAITATGPATARLLAAQQAGDEGPDVWRNPNLSTCERIGTTSLLLGVLTRKQISHVVLRDYFTA